MPLRLYYSRNDLNVLSQNSARLATMPHQNITFHDCSAGTDAIAGLFDRHRAPLKLACTHLAGAVAKAAGGGAGAGQQS